jgi:signal transduction histidine kinase
MVGQIMDVLPSPVPWAQLAAFIRQLGHDIRNDLNALSLEAALLKELVADPEAVTSANRIQTQLREIANRLKELSARYVIPAPQVGQISISELITHL